MILEKARNQTTTVGDIKRITSLVSKCACGRYAIVQAVSVTELGSRSDGYCENCTPERVREFWAAEGLQPPIPVRTEGPPRRPMDLRDMEMSERLRNALKKNRIKTLEDIMALTPEKFSALEGLGARSICEMAWLIISFANGQMLRQRLEWETFLEPYIDKVETYRKAKKYDRIKKLLDKENL